MTHNEMESINTNFEIEGYMNSLDILLSYYVDNETSDNCENDVVFYNIHEISPKNSTSYKMKFEYNQDLAFIDIMSETQKANDGLVIAKIIPLYFAEFPHYEGKCQICHCCNVIEEKLPTMYHTGEVWKSYYSTLCVGCANIFSTTANEREFKKIAARRSKLLSHAVNAQLINSIVPGCPLCLFESKMYWLICYKDNNGETHFSTILK